MDRKAYRAQETRWRFLSVRSKDDKNFHMEFESRTKAREFATWLLETRTIRTISLFDKNYADSGEGWGDPD